MQKIITHPNNLAVLRENIERKSGGLALGLLGIEIIASPFVDEFSLTGKYVLPNGEVVEGSGDWKIETRFVDYGPEDLDYLLKAGIVKVDRVRNFYLIDSIPFHKTNPFIHFT